MIETFAASRLMVKQVKGRKDEKVIKDYNYNYT
jgi:hypothetical protein